LFVVHGLKVARLVHPANVVLLAIQRSGTIVRIPPNIALRGHRFRKAG